MNNQPLVERYRERARDLEISAQRAERTAPPGALSPRPCEATFLRREAAWWRAYAQTLAETAN